MPDYMQVKAQLRRAGRDEAADAIERLEGELGTENKRAQEFSSAIWKAWMALKQIAEATEGDLTHTEIQEIASAALPPTE